MAPKRKSLNETTVANDFDAQAVEQLRQNLSLPTLSSPAQPDSVPAEIKTKRLNVEIPEDLHRWLKSYSAMEGRAMTDIVLDLLAELKDSKEISSK
jgi:hypothetical protein